MGHYKSNLRDIEFTLFEVLGAGETLGRGPFSQLDVDSARDVLREVERLATHDLAASFADADRHPPVFDPATGSVTLPPSFLASYQAYADGGWDKLDLPESLGGIGAPPTLRWAATEMILGANPARTVLVVSHVTPIKTLVRMALDAPLAAVHRMHLDLAAISEIAWYADGPAVMRSYNETFHLEGLGHERRHDLVR